MTGRPLDAELVVTGLLRAELPAGYYIGRVVPETRRDYMVTVRRQGGPSGRFFDRPRMGINLWAPTPEEANDLYRDLAKIFHDLAGRGDNPIKTAAVYGMTEIREPTELHQRYFTVDLSLRTTN